MYQTGARPGRGRRRPRTEPASLGVVRGPALADHGHLDLAGIVELLLDVARDLVRQERGSVVVDLLRLDDHADLPAGVDGVDLVHADVAPGDLLELREPIDVGLERLAARARPGTRERVDDLHDHRLDRP